MCYFDKFNIGNNNNYIEYIFNIEEPRIIKLLSYDKDDNFLFNKNEEIGDYLDLYINNNKINFCTKYNFKKIGKYQIKSNCERELIHVKKIFSKCYFSTFLNLLNFNTNNNNDNDMSDLFSDYSSLTSLNLSNFNTNKINNMECIFDGVPVYCKIITKSNKLLNKFKNDSILKYN